MLDTTEKLRVLYPGDLMGRGLDPRFTRLALRMTKNIQLTIATWGGEIERGLVQETLASGATVRRMHYDLTGASSYLAVRELAAILDSERIQVVHCQCYRQVVFSACASAVALHKPAIVFTDHNSLGWRGFKVVPRLVVLLSLRPFLIDLSGRMSRIPVIRRRAAWIPNGVDTALFQKSPAQRPSAAAVSIIYPARLDRAKGHRDLLQVCSRLRDQNLQFDLLLAGDGPDRSQLETITKDLRLQNHVRFAGHLTRTELLAGLQSADIGVYPSYSEMLPVGVLEMMSTGLPVVAYASGSLPLIIRHGETGYLATSGSISDFERYLTALVRDGLQAREMGFRAAADARARFDLTVVADQLSDFYRSCVYSSPERLPSTPESTAGQVAGLS